MVDFREQIGIYVLYDSQLRPIYVGQVGKGSRGLLARLNCHEIDRLWNRWDHFSWVGLCRVNQGGSLSQFDGAEKVFKAKGRELLIDIEGALITALEPQLNRQAAQWRKNVKEYYQAPSVEPSLAEMDERLERPEALLKKRAGRPKVGKAKPLAKRAGRSRAPTAGAQI